MGHSSRSTQQRSHCSDIGRLRQVMVEAGLASAFAGFRQAQAIPTLTPIDMERHVSAGSPPIKAIGSKHSKQEC
jgi:hypothetical protein